MYARTHGGTRSARTYVRATVSHTTRPFRPSYLLGPRGAVRTRRSTPGMVDIFSLAFESLAASESPLAASQTTQTPASSGSQPASDGSQEDTSPATPQKKGVKRRLGVAPAVLRGGGHVSVKRTPQSVFKVLTTRPKAPVNVWIQAPKVKKVKGEGPQNEELLVPVPLWPQYVFTFGGKEVQEHWLHVSEDELWVHRVVEALGPARGRICSRSVLREVLRRFRGALGRKRARRGWG